MPKRVDHGERRRQIADALLRIARTRGLPAASMREVAAEAGVSLRLVQYYFHTKDELLLGAFQQLSEQLAERVRARIRAAGLPPTPRGIVHGTLSAILPLDEESRQITLTYTAYYTMALTDPRLIPEGLRYPNALEAFLATQLREAQAAGDLPAGRDPALDAAALLALTNGLGSSVLGGQRDGAAALAILEYHLDHLFTAG
jgi:AcrR family transcriptional regulator